MPLTPDEVRALGAIVMTAVAECRGILIAAAERPSCPAPSPPPAPPPLAAPSLLTRSKAAEFLRAELGYPVAVSTLAKLAVSGGGPPFESFGRRVLYRRQELRE
jgi:hypothetical protein